MAHNENVEFMKNIEYVKPNTLRKASKQYAAVQAVLENYPNGAHYLHDLCVALPSYSTKRLFRILNPRTKTLKGRPCAWATPVASLGRGRYILRKYLTPDRLIDIQAFHRISDSKMREVWMEQAMFQIWYSPIGMWLNYFLDLGSEEKLITWLSTASKYGYDEKRDGPTVRRIWRELNAQENADEDIYLITESADILGLVGFKEKDEVRFLAETLQELKLDPQEFLKIIAINKSKTKRKPTTESAEKALEWALVANAYKKD